MARPGRSWLVLACLALGAWGCACAPAAFDGAPGGPAGGRPAATAGQERVPGEYLVTAREGAGEAAIRRLYAGRAVQEVRHLGGRLFLVRLGEDPGPDVVRREGLASGLVSAVQPNFVYRASPPPGRGPGMRE